MKLSIRVIFFVLLAVSSCSPERNNILSKTYHNITAKYNAYFIAREYMKEVKEAITDNHERNFNKILRIYPTIDSAVIQNQAENLEEIFKKSSIAIQRHENSKWVDDSYILIGQTFFYRAEFAKAIETLKYVNTHSKDKDARHKALISLMRTFIHFNELNNAIYVSDFLKKEKLNKDNAKDLALVRAHLYQEREDYNQVVSHLSLAAPLMKRKEGKPKIYFILGQIYQDLGFDAEAYNHYNMCLKSNPDYELSFYAKLSMAQVTELSETSDVKKVRKYFRKLLRDPKNEEFSDKIYYEVGNFELKQDNIEAAIKNYEKSVASSVSNPRQKAYSYLKLGELYYDHFKKYELAKSYYDSVVTTMPDDDERFIAVKERQEILADFVKQINTIKEQDSLIQMSEMDSVSLMAFINDYISEKEQEAEEKAREAARKSRKVRFNNDFDQGENVFSTQDQIAGQQWYFYNPSAISIGRSEFLQKWGNRPLEDNWRRSKKESGGNYQNISSNEIAGDTTMASAPGDNNLTAANYDPVQMYEDFQMTAEQKQQALIKIEDAHYNLGNIYNFQLDEKENSASTFKELIARFPSSDYKPEVLYLLYLIYKDQEDVQFEKYKKQLIDEFPGSVYANLIINPNFRAESNAISEKLKKIYKKAYSLYEIDSTEQALKLVQDAIKQHPENSFSDNLKLLEVLITGKENGTYNYQFALNNFINNHQESDLIPYANELLASIDNFKADLARREGVKYSTNLDQNHYFVMVYDPGDNISERLNAATNSFLQQYSEQENLKTSNLVFNENYSMILINEFDNKEPAMQFFQDFNNEESPLNELSNYKIYNFVITRDNFKTLYSTKGLEFYVNFFKKNY